MGDGVKKERGRDGGREMERTEKERDCYFWLGKEENTSFLC